MKKLINKVLKRDDTPPPTRITSDTIEQHREHILAGGRRFKYPLQYARHKLVFNAIIISLVSVIIAVAIGWWQLYPMQNTSEFMYRVTTFIPVPVAMVDGQPVLYSDYLMAYRSSVYFSEKSQQLNVKSDDGKRQLEYFKQQSMHEAIADAYALKLSKSLNVSVNDKELDDFIKIQRQQSNGEVTQQSFDASTQDILGLSPAESRHKISNGLLRQKVSFAMDTNSKNTINTIAKLLQSDPNKDFKSITTSSTGKITYGASGWVPKLNLDGGLALAASKLTRNGLSPVIKSTKGDGYYIVKLLDVSDIQVSYEYIQSPLTAFTDSLNGVISSGKI
ncbi:hypothetical protein HGB25_01570, partial [Candidatus Saccharibacteria bacterium]|nr:hypothetical protein [Candidatus Saccharibacteria bacterium]